MTPAYAKAFTDTSDAQGAFAIAVVNELALGSARHVNMSAVAAVDAPPSSRT
jgi:hypothetical protein